MAKLDLLARFWAKVDQSAGPDGCWIWTGAYNRPSECGRRKFHGGLSARPRFWVADRGMVYAHRFSLSLHDGVPLDERAGREACHKPTCANYRCVNPAHLYWGTPDDNRADRYGRSDAVQLSYLAEGL